jgi:hypothetical protein
MVALRVFSYMAIRTKYCVTSSREVTRPSLKAACISEMEASTTENSAALTAGASVVRAVRTTVMESQLFGFVVFIIVVPLNESSRSSQRDAFEGRLH